MSEDKSLLEKVNKTLEAITALKTGEPTQKVEEVAEVKDEAVEEVKAESTETEAKETEAAEEVAEVEAVAEATEAGEEEVSKEDEGKEASVETPVVKAAEVKVDVSAQISEKVLEAVTGLASVVKGLAQDVEALKNAKTSKKSVMPDEVKSEEAQEDTEQAKALKHANYIFGNK
jgi:hypothetical protein